MNEERLPGSRKEARALGLPAYFTGKPCKRGHICIRRASSNCVQCETETNRKWSGIYYSENRDKVLSSNRRYAEQNKARIKDWHRDYKREWYRNKRRNDPRYRLISSQRSRLYYALRGKARGASFVELIGCSIEGVRKHLEASWLPMMTWQNHGKGPGKWQVDHIEPLSAFNLSDPAQLATACHFSNLQPLWNDAHVEKTRLERSRPRDSFGERDR